ncbi:methyl-accepting chemotaxis protein [Oceanobacillus sp. J11TS1]|uniref:methyl-accepting chemotaxis protein n=1 Tax=Oceanobacillus sp. J11TS1 TaxID=2807191 RepID=UPI001B137D12|nr:methyl-accepting chemotaxis protein [Oceanobacillus sp. J11TS1]GIO25331.1 putative sensory transducer protein YvaQ [Oceanobacillus sp. J11TS1]
MKVIFNLKSIKSKIILAFSVVILLVIILGAYSSITIKKMNDETKEMVENNLQMLNASNGLETTMANRIATARGYVLTGKTDFKEDFEAYTKQGAEFEELARSVGVTEEFENVIRTTNVWQTAIIGDVFEVYDRGDEEQAIANLNGLSFMVDDITAGYRELAANSEAAITQNGEKIIVHGEQTVTIVIIVSVLILILSITAVLVTGNLISKPIKTVMERMKLIASGDLSKDSLQTKTRDEVGQLVDATNEMASSTRNLLRQINEVSETVTNQSEELTQAANEVKSGSEQVAITMQELAAGSEKQANSASNLSEITGTFALKVQEVNENGEHVQQYSDKVLEMTTNGSELMTSSTEQMAKIDKIVQGAVSKVEGLDAHSKKISHLVSVIKDIADQTNLLALNAAIEAARAGEHGKGFTVVAEEVRKLAEQVAVSVTDITDIVANIQNETSTVVESLKDGYTEVEQGTNQIVTTGKTFHKINESISNMADNINLVTENLAGITTSNQEMKESIEEIASISQEAAAGVEQTSASTQQTNSSMEEVAGSSEQLSKLAEEMNGLVRQFKL